MRSADNAVVFHLIMETPTPLSHCELCLDVCPTTFPAAVRMMTPGAAHSAASPQKAMLKTRTSIRVTWAHGFVQGVQRQAGC